MVKDNSYVRWVFLALIICFFFPFFAISCEGKEIKTFSGMQLVTGTTVDNTIDGTKEKVKPQGYAVVALLAAAFGLLVSFLKTKLKEILNLIAGGVGFISLLLLKSDLASQAAKDQLTIESRFGFYLTLILFIISIGWSIFILWQNNQLKPPNNQ